MAGLSVGEQAVAFQLAQVEGEHPAADARDGALRRLATIADVASTARWLASPAASYITGKIIEIDGGAEAPVFPDTTPDLQPANKHQQ